MSNYVKATNFTAKDALPTGDSGKIVKGTEIDVELTAIASAIASKSDSNNPTFTGTPLAPTASAGTNNTQVATTAFVTTAVAASFPTGGIILWSGSIASIPSGWALCNGSNGTPDLRNRFVVGAGSTYAVNATGGSADAIVVSHTHTFSATSASTSLTGAIIGIAESFNGSGSATGVFTKAQGDPVAGTPAGSTDTSNGGRVTMDASHTHAISGTTASTGSSGTNANLPPYYALAYIMKL
jgi:hypothetical protein